MVNKIFQFLHKEVSGVHQAAYLLGFFALLSQILALARDKLLALTFGAGSELDLYYAAFRIPDFLFVTVGSLVSLSIIIPFLASAYREGLEKAREFIDSVFTLFISVIILISVLVFFSAPFLIETFFPGFSADLQDKVVDLTRVLLLSPILLGISNLFGGLTQSQNRFFVYAVSPLLYNLGIIFGILTLYPKLGLIGLVWGVVLGALLHLLIQVPTVLYLKIFPRITLRPKFNLVKEVATVSLPRTFTLSISHISIFFIVSLASLMTAGSIAVFTLAYNLQSVPLSIFGVSYSMATFPALSRLWVSGEVEKFKNEFLSSARQILFWVMPASVLFIVLRAHIVRVIFGAGEFDWTDTRLTAAVLALFAISLVLQSLILLFIRGFYAQGKTSKPLGVMIISGIVIVVSSYLLVNLFQANQFFRDFIESLLKIEGLPGTEVTMLALGFTLGSLLEGVLIWVVFAQNSSGITRPLATSFFRIFSASVIAGFVTFVALRFFDLFFSLETFSGVFFEGLLSGICGIISLILVLYLLKSPELSDVYRVIHQRFWKAKAVSPDTELV